MMDVKYSGDTAEKPEIIQQLKLSIDSPGRTRTVFLTGSTTLQIIYVLPRNICTVCRGQVGVLPLRGSCGSLLNCSNKTFVTPIANYHFYLAPCLRGLTGVSYLSFLPPSM